MEPEHQITFGPFRLETTPGRLWRDDHVIPLRPRSLAMLRYLVAHPGRLVTKAEVQQHVWAGTHVSDSVLRVSVQEIRAALGDSATAPRYLETVGRQGYRWLVGGDLEGSPPLTAGLLVGRQGEVEALERWYQRAAQGTRQLVFISGEAGVGKTTVVELFLARLAAGSGVWTGWGKCVEHYGEGEPYLPFLEALGRLGHRPEQDAVRAVLRRYAPIRAGEVQRAVHYWQQTGENAGRRNVYPEAFAALRKGLTLLATLPESPERTQQELALQITLGELVMAVKGRASPEAGEVYTRAHALCQQVGEPRQLIRVLWGLIAFYNGHGRLRTGEELGRQLLDLAHRRHDAILVQESLVIVGGNALYRGDLVAARAHLEQSLEISAVPQFSTTFLTGRLHPRITSYAWILRPLWELGYADQARQRCQEGLALAQQLGHPPSLALVEYFAATLSQTLRDAAATYARAEALMAFATAQGLMHRVEQGRILWGWALAMQGDAAAGVRQIHHGLAAHRNIESPLGRPHRLSLLAEAYGQAGQPEAGLTVLAEAITLVTATEERWWEAELYRLQGALLLQLPLPDVGQAEGCFRQALDMARHQQAKALELRAALSLARLWRSQGKREEPRQLLVEIYRWFTEGFDTADLQEAKALLEELGASGLSSLQRRDLHHDHHAARIRH